jgi:hypothetical protein
MIHKGEYLDAVGRQIQGAGEKCYDWATVLDKLTDRKGQAELLTANELLNQVKFSFTWEIRPTLDWARSAHQRVFAVRDSTQIRSSCPNFAAIHVLFA